MRKTVMLVVLCSALVLLLVASVHSKKLHKSTDCYAVTVVVVLGEFTFVSDNYQIAARNSGVARADALKFFREDYPQYKGSKLSVYEVSECKE